MEGDLGRDDLRVAGGRFAERLKESTYRLKTNLCGAIDGLRDWRRCCSRSTASCSTTSRRDRRRAQRVRRFTDFDDCSRSLQLTRILEKRSRKSAAECRAFSRTRWRNGSNFISNSSAALSRAWATARPGSAARPRRTASALVRHSGILRAHFSLRQARPGSASGNRGTGRTLAVVDPKSEIENLDVGTGSGVIALSSGAKISRGGGSSPSMFREDALALAHENAARARSFGRFNLSKAICLEMSKALRSDRGQSSVCCHGRSTANFFARSFA